MPTRRIDRYQAHALRKPVPGRFDALPTESAANAQSGLPTRRLSYIKEIPSQPMRLSRVGRFLDRSHGCRAAGTSNLSSGATMRSKSSEESHMQATEILSSEHRVIERMIAGLSAAVDRLEAGEAVRPDFFLDAVRFIRNFADGHHHGKEEGALFEAMARNGMPMDDGPIGVMLSEHDRARELTSGLGNAVDRWIAGERGAADTVADYAREYGELLTQHMYKEDNILFPMAAQAILPQDQDRILDEFERIEREQAEKGSKASYVDLAQALCEEMGVDADAPRRKVVLPCHAR
jgi:hemerythrin-like domain-containing protein